MEPLLPSKLYEHGSGPSRELLLRCYADLYKYQPTTCERHEYCLCMPTAFIPLQGKYDEYTIPAKVDGQEPEQLKPAPLDYFAYLAGNETVEYLKQAEEDYKNSTEFDVPRAIACLESIYQHCQKFPDPDHGAQVSLLQLLLSMPLGLRQHYAGKAWVEYRARELESINSGIGDWVLSLHVLEQMLFDKLMFTHRLCLPCGDAPPLIINRKKVWMPDAALV